jgi:hypothetical protein
MSKRKTTRHTLTWIHPITGKPRSLELTHTRDYLQPGNDHLEMRSTHPRNTPHPLSATGYSSHFIDADELKAKGGAVRFATHWLASEARSKTFIAAEQRRLQGDLFAGGDAAPASPRQAAPARRPPPRHQR